jgi:hypothetical protein
VYVKQESRTDSYEDYSNETNFNVRPSQEVLKGTGSFMWRGSIGWCAKQMPASTTTGVISNSLYSSAQIYLSTGFILTTPMSVGRCQLPEKYLIYTHVVGIGYTPVLVYIKHSLDQGLSTFLE